MLAKWIEFYCVKIIKILDISDLAEGAMTSPSSELGWAPRPRQPCASAPILTPLRLPEARPAPPALALAPCPLCELEFQVEEEEQRQVLLRHLLLTHSFVIAEVGMVGCLASYLTYWRRKFLGSSVAAYCTTVRGEVAGQERDFALLSDIVPEDKELRRKLQEERLEQVLAVQEQERGDTSFLRGCLFCRQEFTLARELLDHMAFDHNFSVGQPDNLVFVPKFLDLIEQKLEALICLHCEKVFKSREVLKEHMRKKQHKQLNPRNKVWDQFYLVNYLEFGRCCTYTRVLQRPIFLETT